VLPAKPADDAEKPADDAEKPADDAEKPADDAEKPADDAEKPADDAEKPQLSAALRKIQEKITGARGQLGGDRRKALSLGFFPLKRRGDNRASIWQDTPCCGRLKKARWQPRLLYRATHTTIGIDALTTSRPCQACGARKVCKKPAAAAAKKSEKKMKNAKRSVMKSAMENGVMKKSCVKARACIVHVPAYP
jgi:hypothetical protein